MSKQFREWKQFVKLYHNYGHFREYKPTMYYYKKMIRKIQRAQKREEKRYRQFCQELMKE